MDSANSGSMQSSDEEYESRGEFLNPSSGGGGGGGSSHFGSFANHQQQQQQYQSSLFNPNSSQNLEAAFGAQSSNVNNNTQYGNDDDVWSSRGLRSQNNHHHHPNFENFVPSSSSSINQSLFGASQLLINQFSTTSSSSTMPLGSLVPSQSAERNPPRGGGAGTNNDHQQQSINAKNPKKRTRASRRAPTTVLNTDTTNFRQMVQEFTGIPAAPFSSSPYSRRLDLFSGGGGGGGLMGIRSSANLDPLYPLRPSTQKLQNSPFLPQSSSNLLTSTMLEALVSATNASTTTNTNSPDNLVSIHNQILSFQQQPTSLKNSAPNLSTKSLNSATTTTANANVTSPSSANNNNNNNNNLRSTTHQQHQHQGVPVVTSFDDLGLNHENGNQQQMGSNYQFNCSAPTSSGEGTLGQWACPDH